MKLSKIILLCAAATFLIVPNSFAQDEGRHARLFLANSFGGRINPEGFSNTISAAYHYYYSASDSILFGNNHVGFALTDTISPATNAIGGYIEFEPVAVFNLRVQYEYLNYFGVFTAIASFPDKNSDYSDSVLDFISENDKARFSTGTHLMVQPTFQFMYKRIVAMDTVSFEWFNVDVDNFFYEPSNDTLMKHDEYFFMNTAIAGYEVWGKDENTRIFLGSRYMYFRVQSTSRERHELDGAVLWMMGKKLWFMENPILMLAMGGFIEDRYREKDLFTGVMFNFEHTLM